MKYIFFAAVFGLLIFVVSNTRVQQLTKSVWLIIQTSPYQQVGSGAGLIVVLGDSTAYGTGVKDNKESVAGRIGTDFPAYEVRTVAQNGQVIREATAALTEMNLGETAEVLLLQIGGNDILRGRTAEQIENDTRALLSEAKRHATHVLFMSSGNVGTAAVYVKNGQPDSERQARTLAAREIFMRVAAEYGVTYIDLYLEPDVDIFLKNPETYFASDGLHPSRAGYGQWYNTLRPDLLRALSSE